MKDRKSQVSPELVFKYLDGQLSLQEVKKFWQKISNDPEAMELLVSLMSEMKNPPTKEELLELDRQFSMPPDHVILKKVLPRKPDSVTQKVGRFIAKIEDILPVQPQFGRPIALVVLLITLLIGIFGVSSGIEYYRTDYQFNQVENKLKMAVLQLDREQGRLSMEYKRDFVSGTLMDAEADELKKRHALEGLRRQTISALEHAPHSTRGKILLSHVYYAFGEFGHSDSVLTSFAANEPVPAAVFNDRGVLAYDQRLWQEAAALFEQALEVDPKMPEAFYNLIKTRLELNEVEKAQELLIKYRLIEKNEIYVLAILDAIDKKRGG